MLFNYYQKEKKSKNVFILDAGHGWDTAGKRSINDSLRENEFNEAIVSRLAFGCGLLGLEFEVTSKGWKDASLAKRVVQEREIYVKVKEEGKNTFFVSIHANAASSTKANGLEVYYYRKSKQGEDFAIKALEYLRHENKIRSRGVKSSGFRVLKETFSPAILVECGFMTNEKDLELLLSEEYRNLIANNILECFCSMSFH